MSEAAKDTIYIDVDDEITSIIDKVNASKHKIVALVLPKRATVLQSIVNMKLLKRRGDDAGKRVVLITSEKALLPLAGAVGLYTAKTLQSKPAVPAPPEVPDDEDLDEPEVADEPDLDDSKSIGELAGDEPEETIDIDNEDSADKAGGSKADKKAKKAAGKKDKKLKIPNFDSFRTRLFLGIGGFILLLILWFFATHVLPKSKITVKADTSSVAVSPSFTADTAAKEVNDQTGVAPAELKQYPKTDTQLDPATGQKDNGTKASGTVSLKNCTKQDGAVAVPAGSALSTNGLTYITQEAVNLPGSTFSGGGTCTTSAKDVSVAAQQNGDKYNLSGGQTFSVAGFSLVSGVDSSAMTGGTSKIVKIVSQIDVDTAKAKIIDKAKDEARNKLFDEFQKSGQQGIVETLSSGTPQITAAPAVGQEGDNVTVTANITFTMLGVKKDDLKKFIENDAKTKVDTTKQPIQDFGFDDLSFQVLDVKNPNQVKLTLFATATAGVKLDTDAIKKQIAGKKRGDVQSIIGGQTGVKEVDVLYSPFWVSRVPKKASKITIVIEQTNPDAQPKP